MASALAKTYADLIQIHHVITLAIYD